VEVGGINNNYTNNSIDTAKNKASDGEFEKKLKSAMDKDDDKELKKVCQDFEGLMLNMLYKQMKATVPKSELLQEDSGMDIFQSMLDDKLVEESSKSGSLGLANVLYKQLSRQMKSSYKPEEKGDTGSVEKK
jgi:peptidoglycan hydrolase FlgJ